jgi:hypothetical protein
MCTGSNRQRAAVPLIEFECLLHLWGKAFTSLRTTNYRHGQIQPRRLSGIDVARVTKKLAARAGLDPAKYAGH